jgi:hypothetical protein
MTDHEFDALMDDAPAHYRVPPAPPLDDIWARVEADAFAPRAMTPARRGPAWWMVGMAAAASLTIGVLAGRRMVPTTGASAGPVVAAAGDTRATTTPVSTMADPGERLTEEVLGRTALLLASLPHDGATTRGNPALAEQAGRLLSTTRLLLDSPSAQRPQLRALLQDLELVLVQVAQLRVPRTGDDLSIIKEAVEERALVPRIKSAVADLAGGGE